ncbi:Metallo-dependent phosphatase, partial [Hortaea werneckii]
MTRRITRTLGQAAAFVALVFLLVFIADYQYKVLPSSLHTFSPTHHAGTVVTDIKIAFCSKTNPFSTCRLDPEKWHRIEKDLFLHTGWTRSAWLHVKRKREEELTEDDKIVVGVRVGRLDPGVGESGQGGERWESRDGGLWLLRSSKKKDSDSERVITAVDVLFGTDAVDPRPGWTLAQMPLLLNAGESVQVARLSMRHGQPKAEVKTLVPRVNKGGKFKVLQLSDAHLATGVGVCRDAIGPKNEPSTNCEADIRTLEFIETILDDEKPDLVVLSGDQVEGPQSPDTQSTLFKLAAPLIERQIPFAAIFGNHDDEGSYSLSREAQMSLMQTLPYSLSRPGPESVDGVGNYYVEVLAQSPSQHSALTIYLLDTHGLTPDERHYKGYDWLKDNQISWFRSTAQGLKKEHA